MSSDLIAQLQKFYHGFELSQPQGNNAFSYDLRKQRAIYVPPAIAGTPGNLTVGEQPAFCEVEDGSERICRGLKNFIYYRRPHQHVFFFDNHNHAFFFWMVANAAGLLPAGSHLLHVDQHRDMRKPLETPPFDLETLPGALPLAFHYCQQALNVGNFIHPALDLGLFSDVQMIDNSAAFREAVPGAFILDIDVDIFAPEMSYIDDRIKIERIRDYLRHAEIVTVATSPYFIDQKQAISIIKRLFAENDC